MGAYADAATHMADHQVQVLVVLAVVAGVHTGDGLLVQGVEDGLALKIGVTGDAGDFVELVHYHRVGDVGVLQADDVGQTLGDETA